MSWESESQNEFAREFSDEKFREKLLRYAKTAGSEVVERSLQLYYALDGPDTPKWAKGVIIGALGYFITPLDAIPDFVPAAGYSDDLGVLVLALATVAFCITPQVKDKAKQKLQEWFG
ncbi:MAG: YkvA family protein [Pirellulales bacterium]